MIAYHETPAKTDDKSAHRNFCYDLNSAGSSSAKTERNADPLQVHLEAVHEVVASS